jgi:hypothetical protein
MDEQDLADLLDRLGDGVRVPVAPADQIVSEATRVRRRRMWSTIGAAAAVVGVILATAAVVGGDDRDALQPTTRSPATTVTTAAPRPGCEPFDGTIQESKEFTPYADQRGLAVSDLPINPGGGEAPTVPPELSVASVNGLPRQWAIVAGDGSVYQYYLDHPIDPDMTRADFQEAGGIELEANPAEPDQNWPATLRFEFGDRAVPVDVGNTTGVVVWAEPESSDELRMHHVYWDADGFSFGLLVDSTPEAAVTSARVVACSLG